MWNLVFSDSAFRPRAPNFIITHDQTTTTPAQNKKIEIIQWHLVWAQGEAVYFILGSSEV